jgi:hypothetical protein
VKRGQPEFPFRNHSAAPTPATPTRVRVPVPAPQFASPAEVKAYRAAVAAVPRQDGESLLGWLTRVAARAQETLE